MRGAIGCAAACGCNQRFFRIRNTHHDHALVNQRQHHRQQRRFLATMLAAGAGEHAGGFSDEGSGEPLTKRLIDKVFHGCSHIAEAGGRAQHQAITFIQILGLRVRRPIAWDGRLGRLADRRYWRHRAKTGITAGDAEYTIADRIGKPTGAPIAAVVKHKDFQSFSPGNESVGIYHRRMGQHLKLNLSMLFRAMATRERELRLGQSAASLSFISLLAMVPLLTVVFATLASFPLFGRVAEAVQLLVMEQLLPEGFASTIFRYLNQFVAKARTLSLVGIAILLVAATVLMLTLDRTLNLIWRVRRPRPLLHRLSVYWLALVLGPLLVGAGAALAILIAGGRRAIYDEIFGIGWWDLVNLGLVVAAFAVCYRWVPNVTVRWRDALIGGAVGAVISELSRLIFVSYFGSVPTYRQIYGPLAAIPALLIWTYLTWWAFLAGALLASILPEWRAANARISGIQQMRSSDS